MEARFNHETVKNPKSHILMVASIETSSVRAREVEMLGFFGVQHPPPYPTLKIKNEALGFK